MKTWEELYCVLVAKTNRNFTDEIVTSSLLAGCLWSWHRQCRHRSGHRSSDEGGRGIKDLAPPTLLAFQLQRPRSPQELLLPPLLGSHVHLHAATVWGQSGLLCTFHHRGQVSSGASQWAGDGPQRLCAARLGDIRGGRQGKEAGRPLVRTDKEIRCPLPTKPPLVLWSLSSHSFCLLYLSSVPHVTVYDTGSSPTKLPEDSFASSSF